MRTDHQIAQFHRTGYLSLEQVIGLVDVHRVQELLDGLFARFHELPKNKALDLGDEMRPQGGHQIAEINRTIRLEPRLKQTLAFIKCREISGQLLGQTAYYSYDHAIYKPPRNQRATPWHQDQAYTGHTLSMGTIHFWLAMQDVNEDNGACSTFRTATWKRSYRIVDELLRLMPS